MKNLKIILAKTAGFCFGVDRAVRMVEKASGEGGVKTLGPVIHSSLEVARLEGLGAKVLTDPCEALEDDRVIIRSHGVSKQIEDELSSRGAAVIDATCPYVKKIHEIVRRHHDEGYQIVIVGDRNHPEVLAINGRCQNSGIIISSDEELGNLPDSKLCVVAQTTSNRRNWEKIIKIIKKTCNMAVVFDTICSATNERQEEAENLSKNCDCVIVIGGKNSSNTTKLFEICSLECDNVFHIESAAGLPDIWHLLHGTVGITAGASAPDWIIKEVVYAMEEMTQNSELSFAEEFEKSLITLNTGDIVKGKVIGITPTEVFVDLGYKADGVISLKELTDDPDAKTEDLVKEGEEIEVFVIRVSDVEGTVGLSKKKIDSIKQWDKLNEAFENKEKLTGKIISVVNGGVIALCEDTRVFVPASQADERYLKDLSVLVGREVPLRIIDINKKRRKVVASVKAVMAEERSRKTEEFWAKVDAGQKEFDAVVKTLTSFGAFVDLGGVDGLVHISELSWGHIKHPSEVLKEGDTVSVAIIEANKETGKISLRYRKDEDNPWVEAKSKFNVGDVVDVKVVRLVPFGAFVEMLPGVDGLIHISQIADRRIGKPADELSVGQVVAAKITDIDWDAQKIALSIRELIQKEEPVAEQKEEEPAPDEENAHTEEMGVTLADSMGEVMEKLSEE